MQIQAIKFPEQPTKRAMQLEIPAKLWDRINKECKRLGLTKVQFMSYAAELALQESEKR